MDVQARTYRDSVVVACPDARPPAYQAVVGMHRAAMLKRFVTSYYHDPDGLGATLTRKLAPALYDRWRRLLARRHDDEIPADRVASAPTVDLALRVESKFAGRPRLKRAAARARTHWFDRRLARELAASPPEALLVFSDVGSGVAMPLCRRRGIATVLSMVHGDVREEARLLEAEEALAPDFFPLYLGDAALDREEMAWLHARRLQDLALADRILVPSEHIAATLEREGVPRDRLRVIPYAADCRRFRPLTNRRPDDSCTFLFAGGVSQRKGIKYLLEAWAKVRRPGWRLQLLGPMPRRLGPLEGLMEGVEPLGRVGHPEVPAHMASADVFVFPSLFEGSAVVTYEALACGLPAVVTPEAGSVVRDGVEGLVVPARDVDALAAAMARLGDDPTLRARMSAAARGRAMDFDWPRYHVAVVEAVVGLIEERRPRRGRATERGRAPLARAGA
ncbi:glycosyltransferase family 4 protein [Paludisphaera mucosa]|uniref:Glycosyltransferase family 4 protein n=1 Tax=Paludisphaera mucosa TaxID=3030827 RepID=A0ABT6FJ85_9BACT|nr:glycosyltransferase family 4 protein [Paludisphaera mucosa]MDG3007594.1 glycosyltransferase family 4 protein [Paludisphaera mucosa]